VNTVDATAKRRCTARLEESSQVVQFLSDNERKSKSGTKKTISVDGR